MNLVKAIAEFTVPLLLGGVLLLAGCSDPHTAPWSEFYFKLPTGGDGVLDVRPLHPYLAEYEYRIRGKYGGKTFSVEPFPQTGGNADIRLDWLPATSNGGPFLLTSHEPSGQKRLEKMDLNTGQIQNSNSELKAVKLPKTVFVGKLDSNCDFWTSTGRCSRQEIAPERIPKSIYFQEKRVIRVVEAK